MNRQYDVVTVGMINFDVNAKGFCRAMVDRKVSDVQEITLSLGGDAQNCALTLNRLGMRTAICGAVGEDMAGDCCLREMDREGVDVSHVKRKPGMTGTAIQLLEGSEASVLYNAGVNERFSLDDVPSSLFEKTRVMCLNSFFGCGGVGADLLSRAKAAGVVTVADTTTLMPGDCLEDIGGALQYVDYFLPSFMEASQLTGQTDPAQIARLLRERGAKQVIVKLGEKGCFIQSMLAQTHVAGYNDVQALDTTGCGDNFVAGFIAGLIKGYPLVECAQLANAAGAINALKIGSNGAVRSFEQLLEFREAKKREGENIQ